MNLFNRHQLSNLISKKLFVVDGCTVVVRENLSITCGRIRTGTKLFKEIDRVSDVIRRLIRSVVEGEEIFIDLLQKQSSVEGMIGEKLR